MSRIRLVHRMNICKLHDVLSDQDVSYIAIMSDDVEGLLCVCTIPCSSVYPPYPSSLCTHHTLFLFLPTIPCSSVYPPYPAPLCTHHTLLLCVPTIPWDGVGVGVHGEGMGVHVMEGCRVGCACDGG